MKYRPNSVMGRAVSYASAHPEATYREVAEAIGAKYSTVNSYLSIARSNGDLPRKWSALGGETKRRQSKSGLGDVEASLLSDRAEHETAIRKIDAALSALR